MRRRAHIIYSGLDRIKVNTSFKAQKEFKFKDIQPGQGIDLIDLKASENPNSLPFVATLYDTESDGPWMLFTLMDKFDVDEDEVTNSPYVVIVEGLKNAYGDKDVIGYVTKGQTKSFEVFVP